MQYVIPLDSVGVGQMRNTWETKILGVLLSGENVREIFCGKVGRSNLSCNLPQRIVDFQVVVYSCP
jgi:hypothetical protein